MKKFLRSIIFTAMVAGALFLTGCGLTLKDIKISVSYEKNENGFLSMLVGEEKTLDFFVTNLPKNASASLQFTTDSTAISKPEIVSVDTKTGKNTVKFKALTRSSAPVSLTARAEGGNSYTLKIVIDYPVESFELRVDKLFAVRGSLNAQKLLLNSSLFKFNPIETKQTELIFKDANNNEIFEIDANEYPEEQSFVRIFVSSPHLTQAEEYIVELIEEIKTVDVYEGDNQLLAKEQTTEKTEIYLVSNREDTNDKNLGIVIQNTNSLLEVKAYVGDELTAQVLEAFEKRIVEDNTTTFNFRLQAISAPKTTTVTFVAYYKGFEDIKYEIVRTFDVKTIEYPDRLFVNEKTETELGVQTLITGLNTIVVLPQLLSIFPADAKFDKIEVEYDTSSMGAGSSIGDYIEFKIGNVLLGDRITDLSKPFTAKGIGSTNGATISLVLKVYWGSEIGLENQFKPFTLSFEVKTGASALNINSEFSNKTVYVDLSAGTQVFNGLYVTNTDAYTENILITEKTANASVYASVRVKEAVIENGIKTLPFEVTGLAVGEGTWNIRLANGANLDLKIITVNSINNFELDYDKNNSSPASLRTYNENGGLEYIGLELAKLPVLETFEYKATLKLNYKLNPSNFDTSKTGLYTLNATEINLVSQSSGSVHYDKSKQTLTMLSTINGFKATVLKVTFVMKKVQNFKLVSFDEGSPEYEDFKRTNVFERELQVQVYLPLERVFFNQSEISLYSESALGYHYKELAVGNVTLQTNPAEIAQQFKAIVPNLVENSTTNQEIRIDFSASVGSIIDTTQKLLIIDRCGTYNYSTGELRLDFDEQVGSEPVFIYVTIRYYGKAFTTQLRINRLQYIKANRVRLLNYIPDIYLDAANPSFDVYAYVLPENAMHKDLIYSFEQDITTQGGLVNLTQLANGGIKISLNSQSQHHLGGSGNLIITPKAGFGEGSTTELSIRVFIGNGDKTSPYRISNAAQLKNIAQLGLDKYYQITNIIDFSSETNFSSLGVFTGSITGVSGAGIVGINIKKLSSKNGEYFGGLFQEILPQKDRDNKIIDGTGMIENLFLSGSIEIELTNKSYLGLLAGVLADKAVIKNVTVQLQNSTVKIMTDEEVKIGGVVGENKGHIYNEIGKLVPISIGSEELAQNKNLSSIIMLGALNIVNYQQVTSRSFVGGIAGMNSDSGLIEKITYDQNHKFYGNDVYFAISNISLRGAVGMPIVAQTLAFSIGALAGKNAGIIKAQQKNNGELDRVLFSNYIKVGGLITLALQADNIVGGLVGENEGSLATTMLDSIVSRVKIRSLGEANNNNIAYFGGVFGVNNGGSINNIVLQAVEDARSVGTDASMLYSSSFGFDTTSDGIELNGKANIFGFDSILREINASVPGNNYQNLIAQTYVGTNSSETGKRVMVPIGTPATLNNYYGDILIGNISIDAIAEMFAPVTASLVLGTENLQNLLVSENSNKLVAYMEFYQAVNSLEQDLLLERNTQALPFETESEVSLLSFNSSIITISNNSELILRGTGLVRIRISSLLNQKVFQDVYIYVVSATSGFELYENSRSEPNKITAGKRIDVLDQTTKTILPQFYKHLNLEGYDIELVNLNEWTLIVTNLEPDGSVRFEKVGSTYQLTAQNEAGPRNFILKAQLSIWIDGEEFTSRPDEFLKNEEDNEISFELITRHYVGASNIKTNLTGLTAEPIDKFEFSFTLETDDFADEILFKQIKELANSNMVGEFFNLAQKQHVYKIGVANVLPIELFDENNQLEFALEIEQKQGATILKTAQRILVLDLASKQLKIKDTIAFAQTLDLDVNAIFGHNETAGLSYSFKVLLKNESSGLFTEELPIGLYLTSLLRLESISITLNSMLNLEQVQNDYVGNYYIVASAKEKPEIKKDFLIEIKQQQVAEIIVQSFEGSKSDDITSGKEETIYIDPQSTNPNHFRVSVYPNFAEFDFFEIVTLGSSSNALITLINQDGTALGGATLIERGLRISKAKITEVMIIKYAISSIGASNGDIINFAFRAYLNNQIVYETMKNIVVKYQSDVTLKVKNSYTDSENNVFMARGVNYSFEISSNGYKEEEIFITTSRPGIVTVSKSGRTISVTANQIPYPTDNLKGTIEIYGRKTVYGEVVSSKPYVVNFVIVDYVLLLDNPSNTVIRNGTNGIVGVSIGDTYTFGTELLNGITAEYSSQISNIKDAIKIFETSLTKNGIWEYQMATTNAEGVLGFNNDSWITIDKTKTMPVSVTETGGYFAITKDKNGQFVFTPYKIVSDANPMYKFRLKFDYDYQSGQAIYIPYTTDTGIIHEFVMNVYQLSSMDTPTPINSYEELISMNPNSYYILINDIYLPSNFQPITTAIKGLDGNNKKIIINTNLAFETSSAYAGIFAIVQEGTLIRNLHIEVRQTSTITITQTQSQPVFFGLLAGRNLGMVSNVFVSTLEGVSLKVVINQPQIATNYVAALIGTNGGYVTNSRASTNLSASANLAGFVAYNTGKISNSYVEKSLLVNTASSLSQNKTAGFAIYNGAFSSYGGQIIGSYVTGNHTGIYALPIYANDTSKIILSSVEVAGFVYENNGRISDSYSDIPIQTSSPNAGFVFLNKGEILRSYSTSLLKSTAVGTSYGFVETNTGILKNTYFLQDADAKINYPISSKYTELDKTLLQELSLEKFASKENFVEFAFTNSTEINKGVWFMPYMSQETQFNNQKTFIIGKPELVGANILSKSEMEVDFDRTVEDSQTGEITYYYKNIGEFSQGSIYNPILVVSSEELEYRISATSSGNLNSNSFRIVSNLNYSNEYSASKLYNTILTGHIEGNGMEVSGYVVDTSSNLANGGLFAKIGNGSSSQGSVKNLSLKPAYINMPNVNSVGALAGTLDAGTIYNINIDGFNLPDGVVIIGKNLVGGVVGRAIGNYTINTVSSSISTNAIFRSRKTLNPDEVTEAGNKISSYFLFRNHQTTTLSNLSYAGGVAGVLAGTGRATNISVSNRLVAMGEWASLVFGGVGNGVVVENVLVAIENGQFVQGATYAGLVAGEFYGQMNKVAVVSQSATVYDGLFKTIPYKPYAIGAVVGLLGSSNNLQGREENPTWTGASLNNVTVKLSFEVSNVNIIGGLVGEMIGGSINSSAFEGSIKAHKTLGGLVGKVSLVESAPIMFLNQTYKQGFLINQTYDIISSSHSLGGSLQIENANASSGLSLGGLIGLMEFDNKAKGVEDSAKGIVLKIKNSSSSQELRMKADSYDTRFIGVTIGGLVGRIEVPISSQGTVEAVVNFENVQFNNRIIFVLRVMKGTYEAGKSTINWGNILGANPLGIEVEGTNVTYKDNGNPVYTGESVKNEGNHFLLKYNENGAFITKGKEADFRPETINSTNNGETTEV